MAPILLPEYRRRSDLIDDQALVAGGRLAEQLVRFDEYADRQQLLVDVIPGLSEQFELASAELAAEFYEASPGGDPGFQAMTALPREWALGSFVKMAADLSVIGPFLERAEIQAGRSTIALNAAREGGRWARYASGTACGFCRILATRGAVYREASEAARGHDHCRCRVVPQRPGTKLELDPRVKTWTEDYQAARAAGLTKPGEIARFMDNAPTGQATLAKEARARAKRVARPSRKAGHVAGVEPPRKPPARDRFAGVGSPGEYPRANDGTPVPFTPAEAPMPRDRDLNRVLGKHRAGANVPRKSEFPSRWDDDDIESAIRVTLERPDKILRNGERFNFVKVVDGVEVWARVRILKNGQPMFWTAFPR